MAKKFTMEKYDEIKKLLADNKVSSSDLNDYILVKKLRYDRYRELNDYTDEQILELVNNEEGVELNGLQTNTSS
jgi:hypothetical protein